MKSLLEQGANPNIGNYEQETPLYAAIAYDTSSLARRDRYEIMKMLVEQGADVNKQDMFGNSPLSAAFAKRQPLLYRYLLQHGANANVSDRKYFILLWMCSLTPENFARPFADTEVMLTDESNRIPPEWKDQVNTISLLLKNGADINLLSENILGQKEKITPLHGAIMAGNVPVVELLLSKGANTSIKNEAGQTPLQYAQALGNPTIIALLQKYGAK